MSSDDHRKMGHQVGTELPKIVEEENLSYFQANGTSNHTMVHNVPERHSSGPSHMPHPHSVLLQKKQNIGGYMSRAAAAN